MADTKIPTTVYGREGDSTFAIAPATTAAQAWIAAEDGADSNVDAEINILRQRVTDIINNGVVYKGSLTSTSGLPTVNYKAGWQYVVQEAGTYAGKDCEQGDVVLCVKGYVPGMASNMDWAVLQANIVGAVTGPASAVANRVAVFDGATGKVIKDSGFSIGKSVPADAKFTDTTYTNVSEFANDAGYLTQHQDISGKADKATTLAGYGITDAKIQNGVITLGGSTITPLTSHQDISGKADDASVVHTSGNETIDGAKTFTGWLNVGSDSSNDYRIRSANANLTNSLGIYSGTSYSTGAYLNLYAMNHASNPGCFILLARDASRNGQLKGVPGGALTWRGEELASKTWVNTQISSISQGITYKGTVAAIANLPSSGNATGDLYQVTAANSLYIWNGSSWEPFGSTITVDQAVTSGSANAVSGGAVYTALSDLESDFNTSLGDYLPLSGGALSGNLTIEKSLPHLILSNSATTNQTDISFYRGSERVAAIRQHPDGYLQIGHKYSGAANWYSGGKIRFDSDGSFSVIAQSTSGNSKALLGQADGTLTWRGKNVAQSAYLTAVPSSGSGYSAGAIIFVETSAA